MKINYDMDFDTVYDALIWMTIAFTILAVLCMVTGAHL